MRWATLLVVALGIPGDSLLPADTWIMGAGSAGPLAAREGIRSAPPPSGSSSPYVPAPAPKSGAGDVGGEGGLLPPFPTPMDAFAEVKRDAARVSRHDALYTRWIWVQSGEEEDFQALSDGLAKISRSGVIRHPIIPQGGGTVVRIDLRWYFPGANDLKEAVDLWEEFQYDPWFSRLVTAGELAKYPPELKKNMRVPVRKTIWHWNRTTETWEDRGKEYRIVPVSDLKDVIVIRFNHSELDALGYATLQEATGSLAPIVHYGHFLGRTLSTIKDDKDVGSRKADLLFATVWGGLYYELAEVRKSKVRGRSDLDQLFIDIGVARPGETYPQCLERLKSDERVAMVRSEVTGKPRRVVWIGTPHSRTSTAAGIVFVTEDIRERDVDINADPLVNIDTSEVLAYEVIWLRRNGQQGYALFGAKGELLDEAANEVATDHDIPRPHTGRLQSAISCIRCHGPYDGWQPLVNDLKPLLKRRFDIYRQRGRGIPEDIERLASRYGGEPGKPLRRAKDDYAEAVLRSTGAWAKSTKAQADVIQLSSSRLSKIWAEDRWNQRDAQYVLRAVGLPAPKDPKLAPAILEKVLPPLPIVDFAQGEPFVPEDVRIGLLLEGKKINPTQFYLAYSYLLERSAPARAELRKGQGKDKGKGK